MYGITVKNLFLLFCVVTAISAAQVASACQVDEFYHTKEGVLAALTPQSLEAASKFEKEGRKDDLAGLVKSGTVLRLAENVKVQVLERSFETRALKIKLPDAKDPYWVRDGSLKQINCN